MPRLSRRAKKYIYESDDDSDNHWPSSAFGSDNEESEEDITGDDIAMRAVGKKINQKKPSTMKRPPPDGLKAVLDLDAVHLSFNVEEDKNCVKEGLWNRLV
jgi:hypothetical protein